MLCTGVFSKQVHFYTTNGSLLGPNIIAKMGKNNIIIAIGREKLSITSLGSTLFEWHLIKW